MTRVTRSHVVAAHAGTQRRCVCALLALALAACSNIPTYRPIIPAELPPPKVVSDSADGSTVEVARTQIISVHLPAEARSDDRWTYELGKDRTLYPAGDTPRFDGPNDQVFTFRAEGVGTTSVRFVYRDPEQPKAPPTRTVAFDVVAH